MRTIDPKKKIILDADVIIHFGKGDALGLLPQIFPNRMYVPDIVYHEALSQKYKIEVNNLFNTDKMDEATCDFFIYNVKLKGSKLPCNTIAEFLDSL